MLISGANDVEASTTAVRVVKKSIGQTTRKPVTLGIGWRSTEERMVLSHAVQTRLQDDILLPCMQDSGRGSSQACMHGEAEQTKPKRSDGYECRGPSSRQCASPRRGV